MATKPYLDGNKWTMDVDPDDESYVVADVTADLLDRGTTASSVTAVISGVIVLEGPTMQGVLAVAKLTMDMVANVAARFITFRVRCANGERFDRTIYFKLEDH